MLGGTAVISDEAVLLRPHPTQEASGAPSHPSFGSEAPSFSPHFFFFCCKKLYGFHLVKGLGEAPGC